MLKKVDENGNIIFGDLSLQKNFNFKFQGKNNIIFLAGNSVNVNVNFHGNNALFFHAGGGWLNGNIDLCTNGLFYIGKNSSSNGSSFRIYEGKSIILGDDCMFSWGIWVSTCDHHLIYDNLTHKRVNHSKSIFVGDHIWCAQDACILKGAFVPSGSVLGARSVNLGTMFSNSIYAGNKSKLVKSGIFWSREDHVWESWDYAKTMEFETMQKDDFVFKFDEKVFLNPALLEARISSLKTAFERLEFVYDYIYNNTHKNRFTYEKGANLDKTKLYKMQGKRPFKELKFECLDEKPLPKGAVQRVQNHLAYKFGKALIENSKSLKGFLKLPFILNEISKEHKNLKPNLIKLENYGDYEEALRVQNLFSYKLGLAFFKAFKTWYKGGFVKFYFEVKKLKKMAFKT